MHLPRFFAFARTAFLLAGCAFTASAAEENTPLLRGILLDSSGKLFSLSDLAGSSTWVKLGQNFAGWRVESYDEERRVLTVSRDGDTRELSLEDAKIQAGDPAKPSYAEAEALLDQMRFEEMIGQSIESQQKAMSKAFTQMTGADGQNLPPEQAEKMARAQAKAMQLMLDEMDLPGMKKELAQAMTEIFTPAELRAQTAFYSTPAGRSTIDKQPLLQERMSELMMPRIMRAMPKIQAAMMEDFESETGSGAPATDAPAAP